MTSKIYPDAASALEGLTRDGITVMAGGFGLCGIPENLIVALRDSGAKDLTVIGNNVGCDEHGMWLVLANNQIKKVLASYVGENKILESRYMKGEIEEGKETRQFNGEWYVMETGLTADIALVKAWKGDAAGNLIYRKTARNFNPMIATAGKVTIAEVEELVPIGSLPPDQIHTPGIFVKRIIQGKDYVKHIERRTTRPKGSK